MDNLHFLLIANALVSVLLIVPHNVLSLSLPPPESLWTLQARRHSRPFFQKTQSAHGVQANQRCRSVLPRNACAAGDKGLNVVGQQVEKETTHAGQHRSGRRMSFSVGSVKRGDSTTKPPVGLRSESQCDSKGLPGDVSTKFNQESSAGAGKRGSPDEETGAGLCGRRALLMEIAGLLLQELLLPPHVSPASVCRCASSVCPSLSTPPVTQVPQDRPTMTRSSPGCRPPPDTFPQTAVEGQEQIRTPPNARLSSPTPAAPGRNPARQRVAGENLRSSERDTHPQAQHTGAVARPADPTERLPPRVQGGSPEVLRRKVSSIMRSEKPTGAHSGPATDSHMNTKPHVRLVLPTPSALKTHERHRAAAVTREVPGESRVASCPVQSEPNPAYEPHGGGAACPLEGEEVQIAARHSTAVSQSEQICASDGGRLPILQQTCGIETRSQSVEGNHRHSPDSHRGAQNLRGEVGGSTMRSPPTLPPQTAPFGQTLSLAAAAETAIVRLRGKRVVYHVRMRTSEQLPAELGRPRRCCLSPSTGAQVWGSHSRASGSRGQDTLGGLAGSTAYGSCQVSRANHGFSGTEAAPSASLRNEQLRLAAVLPRVLADHHTLRTLSAQYGAIVGTFSASLEGVIQLSKAGIFTLLIQLIDQGAEKDTLVGHFFPHLCLDFVPARRVASRILSRGSLFLRLRCLAYWQRQILDDDTPTDVAVSVTGHQAELGGSLESRPIATEIFRDKSLNAGTERHRDGTKDWCCPGRTTARSDSEVSQSWHSVCESDDASAPSSGGSNVGLFAKTPRWAWQLQEVILKCLGPNQPALLRSEAIRIVTIVCRRKTRRAVRIILNLMETGKVSTESWPRVLQLQLLRADEGVRRGERDGWLYNLLNEYLAVAHGDGVETPQKWEGASPGQMQTEREKNSKDRLQHWPTHRQDSRARLYTQDAMCKEERDADSEAGIDPTGCEKIEFRSSKYSPVALRDQTPLKRFVYVRLVEHLMAKVFKLPEIWETRVLGSKVVDLDLYSPGASSAGAHRPPYSVGLGPRGGAVATAFGGYPDAWSRRRTSLRMKPAPPQFPLFQAEVDPGVVEKLVHVPGSIFPSSTSTTTGKEATRPPVSWIFHLLQREEAAGSSVKPARGLALYQEASEASASCSSSHTQSVVEAAFAQLDANIVVPGLAAAITFRRGKMSKGGAGRGFTWMSFVPAQLQVQLVAILESRSMAAQLSRTGGSVANGEKNSGERLRQECRDNEDLGRRRGEDSEDEDAAVRVAAIIREKGVRIALEEGLVSEEAINARMWIVEQFSLDAMVFADSVSAAQRNAMRYVCTSSSSARSSVSSALSSRSSRSGSSSLTPWREEDAKFFSVKDDRTNPSVGLPFAETSADEMSDRWSRTGVDDPATVVAESPPPSARLEQRRGRASALDGLVDLSDLDESYSLVSLGNHEHRVPVRKLLVPRRLLSDVANRTGDKRFLMEGRASRRRSSNTKEDDDSVNGEVLSPFLDVALRVRVNAGGTYADRTGRFQRDAEKAAWEYLSRTEQMVSIWEQMKSSGTHAAAGRGSQAPLSGESSVQQSGLRKVDEETIPASSSEPESGHTPRDVTSQRGKDNEACGPRAMWNSIGPRCLTFNMESFLPPEDEARRSLDSHPERAASPPQEPSTLGPVVLCSGNFRWVFCMHRQPGQGRRDFADFNTFLRRWEQEQYMVHLVRLNGHIVVPRARRVAAAPPPSIISYLALTPSGCRVLLNHPTFLPYLESVLRRPNRVKSSEVCAAIWSVCQMASTSLGNEYLLEYERQKERRRRRAKAYAASKKGSDGEGSMKGGAQAGPCPHHGSGKERSVERIDSADSCGFETRNAGLAAPRPHRKMSLEYGSAVSPAKSTRVLETSEGNGGEQSVSGSLSDPGGENEVLMSVNGEAKRGDSRTLESGNFSSTCHRISRLLRNRDEAECNVSTSALLRLVMRIARRNSPPCVRSTCLHALSLVQVCEPAENAAAATHWDLAARGPVQERLFEYLAGIATGSEADTTDTEEECRDSDRAGRPPEEEKQRPSNLGFRPSVNRGVEGGAACSSRKEGNAADVHDSWISLGQLVWAPPFNPPVPPDGRDFSSLFSLEKAKGGNPGSNHPMSGRTPRNSMSGARTPRKRSKQDSLQRLEEGQQREVCLRDFTAEASSRSVSSSFHEDSMQDGFPSTSTSFDVPYTDGLPRETRARNENIASSLPDDSCRPSYACFGSQHWTILDMISKLPNSVAVRISGLTSQLQSVKHRNPSLFLSVELWWRVEQLMCLYCFSAHLRRLVASLFSETLNDPAALSYLDALSEHLSRLQGNDYHDMDGSG
ncbi:hypothetical protein TGRUB_228390 [Toxoplasma gondii RUB]|uniref:Rapamycin-insensitive companion of mTOR domain-containing protein n=1 Tax=Toxoplasma gondii RUB TaxID=935652 RepID=A0A086M9X5_TOXGO|nr:hypothetical protein TGRUB_228390 [Toxoplasma gondii RUB]